MRPENMVGSFAEFIYLRDEMNIRESEPLTAIEDIKWLKENPPIMTKEEYKRIMLVVANVDQIRRIAE